jgi:hypothetical protein
MGGGTQTPSTKEMHVKIGFLFVAVLILVLPRALAAQVEARPISEAEAQELSGKPKSQAPQEVPSPMLLEVKVSPRQFTTPAYAKQNPNIWTTRETASFVCDKAVVRSIKVQRTLRRKGQVLLEVIPEVATDWFRQDIDLTVALLSADGRELGKRTWESLTIGNDAGAALVFGSRTKTPTLEIQMSEADFLQLFANDQRPVVRVVLDVVDEEEEEED